MGVQRTAIEEQIFETLLAAVQSCGIGAQMRVAGGWVRDKLLGRQSHDIDIALDKCAKTFREAILDYLKNSEALTSEGYIVPKNPERSKHLDSAVVEIYGERIEFVNLRGESYAQEKEAPVGTPMEDAYRRDLTINSLFYNLSTRSIEDLTGRGVADIEAGLIRTPLSALTTLLDDPLRVLRAARFASGLGFQLDPELQQAASMPEVHDALRTKVSRERVAEEAKKMIFGKDPVRAMQLIRELGCSDFVFPMPAGLVLPVNWESSGAEYMLAASELMPVLEVSDENVKCVTALASFLLPLKDYTYMRRGKTLPLSAHVIRDCILYNENVSTEVTSLLTAVGNPYMDSWIEKSKSELVKGNTVNFEGDARVEIGVLLNGLLLLKGARASFRENSVEAFVALMTAYKCRSEDRVTICKALKAAIVSSGLYKVRCLLTGKDVIRVLGVANGSSQVGSWLHRVFLWQLQNRGASASDCEKWMRACKHDVDEQQSVNRGSKRRAICMQACFY